MDHFTEVIDLYQIENIKTPRRVKKKKNTGLSKLIEPCQLSKMTTILEEENTMFPLLNHNGHLPRLTSHIGEGTYGHVYKMADCGGNFVSICRHFLFFILCFAVSTDVGVVL